ncbi:MAG: hypothetical protein ABII09_12245 [Planctomycetota bacterium]
MLQRAGVIPKRNLKIARKPIPQGLFMEILIIAYLFPGGIFPRFLVSPVAEFKM